MQSKGCPSVTTRPCPLDLTPNRHLNNAKARKTKSSPLCLRTNQENGRWRNLNLSLSKKLIRATANSIYATRGIRTRCTAHSHITCTYMYTHARFASHTRNMHDTDIHRIQWQRRAAKTPPAPFSSLGNSAKVSSLLAIAGLRRRRWWRCMQELAPDLVNLARFTVHDLRVAAF